MAEAIVEERPPVPTRFYCHMCNVEISIPNSDYTCPLCSGGFVEELPALAPPTGSSSSITDVAGRSGSDGREMRRLNDLEAIRGEIATLLMSRNGPNVEISIDPGNRRGNLITLANGAGSSTSAGGGGGLTTGGRVRQQTYDRLDNVLIDFLQSISGDIDTPFGNSQMFFMGNPGDYAWGREGIDTIVTQLLNQMETSGPPPLAKEKIEDIPKVAIAQDEVDKKLQCSVCWEDFRLQEIVRKLACSHIYHENCIVPWLNLHGTCPICRKSLADVDEMDVDDVSENNVDYPTHGINARNSMSNRHSITPGVNNSYSTRNEAGGSGSISTPLAQAALRNNQTQSNNIFTFEDGNVDLD